MKVAGHEEALPFPEFLMKCLTEHALAVFVVMAQCLAENARESAAK